jgi:hypothetical protein
MIGSNVPLVGSIITLDHGEALALNAAHDAEQSAWKTFLAAKAIRDHAILDASRAFKEWQDVREHQRSLGGECY